MTGIFKAYDIRGRYPDELDEATAERIGNAFVRLLAAERVVIGQDMRLSSASLARAFTKGAIAGGAEVTDIGMASTPLLNYAVSDGRFDGGVMVTASHLPGEMNGFKLAREDAIPLSGDRDLPLLETMVGEEPVALAGELSGHYYRDMGFTDNALLTMVLVANLLAASGRPLSELIRPLDRYPSTGEINLRVSDPAAVLAVLAARYRDADIDKLDGLTATYPGWWFNIRRSHTEPVVRLNLEADTADLLDEKRREVLSVIRDADPAAREVSTTPG